MESLKKGDLIQIIAPSFRTKNPSQDLKKVSTLLQTWGFQVRISQSIFSKKKLLSGLANTDSKRFADLQCAILDPAVKAIWCICGGYGAMRLVPFLQEHFKKPPREKWFIGFSDITMLHNYFRQKWKWRTLHASHPLAIAENRVAKKDAKIVQQLLLGTLNQIKIDDLKPLNAIAKTKASIQAKVVGGNLSTFSRAWGTEFALNYRHQILLIEDIEEPFRKIDGMLFQIMAQKQPPAAIVLGQFTIKERAERKVINEAIRHFVNWAQAHRIPIVACPSIGHGKRNHPLLLGANATLQLGCAPVLTIRV